MINSLDIFVGSGRVKEGGLSKRHFKFFISKRLVDHFDGNREVAYRKTYVALKILEEALGILRVTNEWYVELEYNEVDRYDSAWFTIELTDEYFKGREEAHKATKPIFKARTGELIIDGHTIEFDPKTRKATILTLALQRPGTGVNYDKVIREYRKIDGVVDLKDKQIKDAIRDINKRVKEVLPEITEFISPRGYTFRVKK